MARTRAFKSGNGQAVRIPSELAYADTDIDLEITFWHAAQDGHRILNGVL